MMGKQSRQRRERMQQVLQAREVEGLVKKARLWDKAHPYITGSLAEAKAYMREHIGEDDDLNSAFWELLDIWNVFKDAIVIDATSPFEYYKSHYAKKDKVEISSWNLKPPFDHCFLEFRNTGVLLDCIDLDNGSDGMFTGEYRYRCNVSIFTFNSSTVIAMEEDKYLLDLRDDGTIIDLVADDMKARDFRLWVAFTALFMLNARNIELVDAAPPPDVGAAYERHFGQPMTKYKTLAVRPMGKRHDRDSEDKPYQGLMPLHIRRGHFAHYTEDAPLFGKYTGTFWRPATAVGEDKNSIVVKDYDVKAS